MLALGTPLLAYSQASSGEWLQKLRRASGPCEPSQSAYGIWASVPSHSSSVTSEHRSQPLALGLCHHEAFLFRHPHALRAWCEPAEGA